MQDYCSVPAKFSLKKIMEEFSEEYGRLARDGGLPFTQAEAEVATERVVEKIEADANMIYGCREDVEGRPEAASAPASGDIIYGDMMDSFQEF